MAPKKESKDTVEVSAHAPITIAQLVRMMSTYVKFQLDPDLARETEGWLRDGSRPAVPLFYGRPGIGKTSICRQIARLNDIDEVITLVATHLSAEDLTGPPFPHLPEVPEGVGIPRDQLLGISKFHGPELLVSLTKPYEAQRKKIFDYEVSQGLKKAEDWVPAKPRMLVIDELMNAQEGTQAALHSLILERKIGADGFELLDNVIIVCTTNRMEDSPYLTELSDPMKTRFQHYLVEPDIRDWFNWAQDVGVHPIILACLRQQPDLIYKYDADSAGMTFANERTWALCSFNIAMYGGEEFGDMLLPILQSIVGPEVGGALFAYVKVARKAPSAADIARDPVKTPKFTDAKDCDIAYVCVERMFHAMRRPQQAMMEEVFPDAKTADERLARMVSAFCQYAEGLSDQQWNLFFTELLNRDGSMPREIVAHALKIPENFVKVQRASAEMTRIGEEGKAAIRLTREENEKKKQKTQRA